MGQQIPAMLMGSAAEGGGAGGQASLGSRTKRGPLFLTPLQTPYRPLQGLLLLSDFLGFGLRICETEKEVPQCLPTCSPAQGIQARPRWEQKGLCQPLSHRTVEL